MRRLPVYLLLDTSGSMYGEPIEAVKNGVQTLISTLRSDPYALETAYISIITFNSTAQQVSPLNRTWQHSNSRASTLVVVLPWEVLWNFCHRRLIVRLPKLRLK